MAGRKRTVLSLLLVLTLPLLYFGCSDSSDPLPGGGQFTANAGGGTGSLGSGGDAYDGGGYYYNLNSFRLESYGPKGIEVRRSGLANAGFSVSVPSFTPEFGAEALIVASDCVIQAFAAQPSDNVNRYYVGPGPAGNTLYHQYSDVTFKAVTGIKVNAGVKLTLPAALDTNWNGLLDSAQLDLSNDLEVLGTLRTAAFDCSVTQDTADPASRPGLLVYTGGGIVIRQGALVTTAADNTTSGQGGSAGKIVLKSSAWMTARNGGLLYNAGTIDASGGSTADNDATGGGAAQYGPPAYEWTPYGYYGRGITMWSDGYVINTGAVRGNGGNGGVNSYGGIGAFVYMNSESYFYNTASVSANGGGGGGGNWGGIIFAASEYASTYNSGALSAKGGSGTSYGGNGGLVFAGIDGGTGRFLNSGNIDASGGASTGTDNTFFHWGGNGGQIELLGSGGDMRTSGNLSVQGGAAADTNTGSWGGTGGRIALGADYGYDYDWSFEVPAGEMDVSGNIAAAGGNGPNGGGGGKVNITYWPSSNMVSSTGGIRMLGYTSLAANGGNGATYGGHGGGIFYWTPSSSVLNVSLPNGPVANEADLSTRGGNGGTQSGGNAGQVRLMATDENRNENYDGGGTAIKGTFSNSGSVVTTGGDGGTSGGEAGAIHFWSFRDGSNSGNIEANGGSNKTDNTYSPADGGHVDLASSGGAFNNTGNITANGGNGLTWGAQGGDEVGVYGQKASLSGSIRANGGNAQYTSAGSRAGDGGGIVVFSYTDRSTVSASLMSVVKGTGGDPAATDPARHGYILVDLVDVTPADGSAP